MTSPDVMLLSSSCHGRAPVTEPFLPTLKTNQAPHTTMWDHTQSNVEHIVTRTNVCHTRICAVGAAALWLPQPAVVQLWHRRADRSAAAQTHLRCSCCNAAATRNRPCFCFSCSPQQQYCCVNSCYAHELLYDAHSHNSRSSSCLRIDAQHTQLLTVVHLPAGVRISADVRQQMAPSNIILHNTAQRPGTPAGSSHRHNMGPTLRALHPGSDTACNSGAAPPPTSPAAAAAAAKARTKHTKSEARCNVACRAARLHTAY